ncbi:MAG TPA: phosphatidylglycerol lysyltransferase domain-containing protein [Microbacterium sp.]|uniref:bifunctional lysylphosphatidylglycerol flippase/synthetase MprF n=1 Tax=Microbacterium sp. TaxID=51671 RepID=UPI002B7FB6BB|nr:phosphatidylglycerol lysyltransferase domain-containing protein [Microbacterium sp.]HWI31486.1 phosphatidylglycerol lysyltransferase domain-containing protein [Microbacterium sp.]
MTTGTAVAAEAVGRRSPLLTVLRGIPVTIATIAVLLIVGVISQSLWRPFEDQPAFEVVAYGLPAFEAGRWWTPLTGTFFVVEPWVFIPTLLGFAGMAFLEHRRGSRVALLYFWLGQLFAIFATAAFLVGARLLPWPWAIELAQGMDVGPSGGTMACIAAAVGLLAAPWRQRGWVVVFVYASISLLFLGTLADVEHAFAILLVLGIDRSFRIQRTTIREQRLLAFATILALGIIQILTLLIPTNGPFGSTEPLEGPWIDVAIDTVVIVLIARGLRRGRRWAWVVSLVWMSLSVITVALILVLVIVDPKAVATDIGDIDVSLSSTVLSIAFFVYLIATRRAFRARRRRALAGAGATDPADVKAMLAADGGGTLSWMATWDGMDYLRTSTGIVPFQTHAGVAIVLADPLGPADGIRTSIDEFVTATEAQGLIPCFFSASGATRDAAPEGWRALVVADDTIVDLPGLTFQGKPWARVRQAFSRAERDGMTFRVSTLSAEPWGIRQQLRAISESWVGDKGLPEMRFTLGTLQEAEDPEVRLALAISPQGDVDGFLSWLPVFGPGGGHRGWTLDLMRRRDGGFPVVMEFLIGTSARTFRDEGAEIMSLSGAPLAHEAEPDAGAIASLLGQLSASLEPVYGFKSLHQFKTKFNPRYEPIYLLYRDEGDLSRIAAGLTRAFLPDATLRQFAAAGVDLVRGR